MQTTDMREAAKRYLDEVSAAMHGVPLDKLERIAQVLFEAYKAGRKIIVFGNGGSAANASHFVCDLGKGVALPGKKRFKVIALCDNVPTLTAYANDVSYDDIFAEQLKNIVDAGDAVIAISGSGNSRNVLKAVELAAGYSAVTIGLTGFEGGKLKGLVSECLVVPSVTMEQIEDVHLAVLHALARVLRGMLAQEPH